jgi:hypothetical protein
MIGFAFFVVEIAIQIIGEEEYPQDDKHNEKFY